MGEHSINSFFFYLVLSDTQSSASSSRRNSSISSHMAIRSQRSSVTGRQLSINDLNENKQNGCLGSMYKLHTLKKTNHRFNVYQLKSIDSSSE